MRSIIHYHSACETVNAFSGCRRTRKPQVWIQGRLEANGERCRGKVAGVFVVSSSNTRTAQVTRSLRANSKVAPREVLDAFNLSNLWSIRSIYGL